MNILPSVSKTPEFGVGTCFWGDLEGEIIEKTFCVVYTIFGLVSTNRYIDICYIHSTIRAQYR